MTRKFRHVFFFGNFADTEEEVHLQYVKRSAVLCHSVLVKGRDENNAAAARRHLNDVEDSKDDANINV